MIFNALRLSKLTAPLISLTLFVAFRKSVSFYLRSDVVHTDVRPFEHISGRIDGEMAWLP